MDKILLVIDMQNDFISGSLGTEEAKAIVPNVKAKIDSYRKENDYVYFTQDTHYENYLNTLEGKNLPIEHCIFGTWGWEIEESVKGNDPMERITKCSFGIPTEQMGRFENLFVDGNVEIEIVGLCTDICVLSNAIIFRRLFPNSKVTVDSSCCAGTSVEAHENALKAMRMCQIEVI